MQIPLTLAAVNDLLPYTGWIVAALIVVVGLFVLGFSDVARFSFRRAWAISGVCFDESIRKKVLWITPLAIIAVLVIAQLQRGQDELDLIRQTVKYCLFATGAVVVITAIILACTNLPKEIESRVIYTVVTKPTTRLEIVLGKVIGFARVSAAILIIMGLFTFGYLHVRSWSRQADIANRLRSPFINATDRLTLEHYQSAGLLTTDAYGQPQSIEVFAKAPQDSGAIRYFYGDGGQEMLVPIQIDPDAFVDQSGQTPDKSLGIGKTGMLIQAKVGWNRYGPAPTSEIKQVSEAQAPGSSTLGPSTQPATKPAAQATITLPPGVTMDVMDESRYSLIQPAQIETGVVQPDGITFDSKKPTAAIPLPAAAEGTTPPTDPRADAYVYVAPPVAQNLFGHKYIYVRLSGTSENVQFAVPAKDPISVYKGLSPDPQLALHAPNDNGQPAKPFFRGRLSVHGAQSILGRLEHAPVAVLSFRNAKPNQSSGDVPFELRTTIEKSGAAADFPSEREDVTWVNLRVLNTKTGKTYDTKLQTGGGRSFFAVPVEAVADGDYDVLLSSSTPDHWLDLTNESMLVVLSRESFAFNLFKSLLIMWMMTILVVAIAIFCSTFLSWPIAVVLTVVLLLGRWGVEQLADASGPGLGRQWVQDIGVSSAPVAKTLTSSIDALSSGLTAVSKVLPDISKFAATEDIVQGVAVPSGKLLDSLIVLVGFGLPVGVLAYIFLKNKEVAP